VAAGILQPGP